MSKKTTTDFVLIAAGVGLWFVGAKTFADYHTNVAEGVHDDFQHKHATAIGSVTTLSGIALAVYGTYRVESKVGQVDWWRPRSRDSYTTLTSTRRESRSSRSRLSRPVDLHVRGAQKEHGFEDEPESLCRASSLVGGALGGMESASAREAPGRLGSACLLWCWERGVFVAAFMGSYGAVPTSIV